MRFWDSSALVPLLVEEVTTDAVLELYPADSGVFAWWASEIECASAIARLERDGALAPAAATEAFHRLRALAASWNLVEPGEAVREGALRLLRVHPLTAADSQQLAAAIVAAENRPSSLELVTLDERLATAAEREGFRLLRPDRD
jgi:predicted nucleic acid-binding protein